MPTEMERMARKRMRIGEDAEPGGGCRGIAGTLACDIHVGSLYYREFPFGGYCGGSARGARSRIFPRSLSRVCARARVCAI